MEDNRDREFETILHDVLLEKVNEMFNDIFFKKLESKHGITKAEVKEWAYYRVKVEQHPNVYPDPISILISVDNIPSFFISSIIEPIYGESTGVFIDYRLDIVCTDYQTGGNYGN